MHVKIDIKTTLVFLSLIVGIHLFANAQTISPSDSTGLPGDNFSLEGALELFKDSSSPEVFEKSLNAEGSKVNNLDLNEDGQTDYIRVVDKSESDAHAFILQSVVSETESQDIAVIELEKIKDDEAVVQIVGDEDVYGAKRIVEPTTTVQVNAGTSSKTATVNVVSWPMVRYVYVPTNKVWVSPYRWWAYPTWYRPWHPVHYRVFYGYRGPYYRNYAVVPTHRVVYAHRVYAPVRTTSVTVASRNAVAVAHYRSTRPVHGTTVTHNSTTVVGPNGHSSTKSTTTVKGKHSRKGKANNGQTPVSLARGRR